jgi:hypothetical protein
MPVDGRHYYNKVLGELLLLLVLCKVVLSVHVCLLWCAG